MKKRKPKTKWIGGHVDESDYEAIVEYADKHGLSIVETIRRALRRLLGRPA